MEYMARALDLAARALRTSSPNPAVGAVLVKDGQVVGEGFTQPPGQAHAEVLALEQAGDRARGAMLYVTLEPCPHHGRTPPCVDAIIAAGVAGVDMAMIDPSPWAGGAGRDALERAGIRTTIGQLEAEARRLIEGYLRWVTTGRPLVTAVYAMSLDGRIAEVGIGGIGPAIGQAARAELARWTSRVDRSMVGIASLARAEGAVGPLEDGQAGSPTSSEADLARLGGEGVTSLLVECGADDLARLVATELLDKLIVFISPSLGGPAAGADGGAAAGTRPAVPVRHLEYERLGDDLMAMGYIRSCSPAS